MEGNKRNMFSERFAIIKKRSPGGITFISKVIVEIYNSDCEETRFPRGRAKRDRFHPTAPTGKRKSKH